MRNAVVLMLIIMFTNRKCTEFDVIIYLHVQFITDDLEWKVGEWGPCLVAENQILEYGTGLMQRNVSCILSAHISSNVSIKCTKHYFHSIINTLLHI